MEGRGLERARAEDARPHFSNECRSGANQPYWSRTARVLRFALAVGAAAPCAEAAPGQWSAGAHVGAASLARSPAAVLGAHIRRGVSEFWSLDLHTSASVGPDGLAATAGPEVGARWDVLQWVPFASAGVAFYHFTGVGTTLSGSHLGVPLRLGVDYLATRRWQMTAEASGHVVVQSDGLGFPWFQLTVGAGLLWGW